MRKFIGYIFLFVFCIPAFSQIPDSLQVLGPLKLSDNLLIIKHHNAYGLWNSAVHNIFLPPAYDRNFRYFPQSELLIAAKNDKQGLFVFSNEEGQQLIPCEYDRIYTGFFKEEFPELILVEKDHKKGIYKMNDSLLYPAIYSDIVLNASIMNMIELREGRKVGMYNPYGNWEIPCKHDKIELIGDLFIVSGYSNSGIYNDEGQVVLSPVYDKLDYVSEVEGYIVKKDGLYGLFGNGGSDTLLQVKYTQIIDFKDIPGAFLLEIENAKGFYLPGYNIFIPAEYSNVCFYEEVNALVLSKESKFGMYFFTDNSFLDVKYDNIFIDKEATQIKLYIGEVEEIIEY